MPSLYEEPESQISQAIGDAMPPTDYGIKTKIIDTSLYSIFLLSSSELANETCQVLLVEHPPAKKPASFLLPLEITTAATKTEMLKKVAAAVEAHYIETKH